MNPTNLNTELLSADARGKKHVPVAVFAVILIHVVLFLILLIAAGCRAHSRADQDAVKTTPAGPSVPSVAQAPVESAPTQSTPQATLVNKPQVQNSPAPYLVKEPVVEKPAPRPSSDQGRFYVVRQGDSLDRIAKQHGTSVKALKMGNNLKSDKIRAGQKLRVDPGVSKQGKKTEPISLAIR